MKLILDAAPAIGENYGVVFNRASPYVWQNRNDVEWRKTFFAKLFGGLPHFSPHVYFLPYWEDLSGKDNAIVDLGADFEAFLRRIPRVYLEPKSSNPVNHKSFEQINEELQKEKNKVLTEREEAKLRKLEIELEERRIREEQISRIQVAKARRNTAIAICAA